MLSVGNVVEDWVPDDGCEAARVLARALEDAREEVTRSKQLMSKFLLRHGHVFDELTPTGRRKGNWTAAYWAWAKSISFPERADADAYAYVSVNIVFTNFAKILSPYPPMLFHRTRQRTFTTSG